MEPGDLLVSPDRVRFAKVLSLPEGRLEGLYLDFRPQPFAGLGLRKFSTLPEHEWKPAADRDSEAFLQKWVFPDLRGDLSSLLELMSGVVGRELQAHFDTATRHGFVALDAARFAGPALSSVLSAVLRETTPKHSSLQLLELALRENPNYKVPQLLVADIKSRQQRLREAWHAYEQADLHDAAGLLSVLWRNNFASTALELGRDHLKRGDRGEAARCFSRAIALLEEASRELPGDFDVSANLSSGHFLRARAAFVVGQLPADRRLAIENDISLAAEYAMRCPESDERDLLLGNVIASRFSLRLNVDDAARDVSEALPVFGRAAIASNPAVAAAARYNIASLLLTSSGVAPNAADDALRHLYSIRDLTGSDLSKSDDYYRLLRAAYVAAGRIRDAMALDRFIRVSDLGGPLTAIRGLVDRHLYHDALQLIEAALIDNPRDPGLNCLAGETLEYLGRPDAAYSKFQIALAERPSEYYGVAPTLVDRDLQRQDYPNAIRWADLALRLAPPGAGTTHLSDAFERAIGAYLTSLFRREYWLHLTHHAQAFVRTLRDAELDYFRTRFSRGTSYTASLMLFIRAVDVAFNTLFTAKLLDDFDKAGLQRSVSLYLGKSGSPSPASLEKLTMGNWADLLNANVMPTATTGDALKVIATIKAAAVKLQGIRRLGKTSGKDHLISVLSQPIMGTRSFVDARNRLYHPDENTYADVVKANIDEVRRRILDVDADGRRENANVPSFVEILCDFASTPT